MPRYCFTCDCGHNFEIFQGFAEKLPKKCPKCKRKEGKGFRQDYSFNVWVYGNPTTLGQLSEENEKRIGKEQFEKMKEKENERLPAKPKEVPFWREGLDNIEKPLDLKKVKDVNKYIATGDKN